MKSVYGLCFNDERNNPIVFYVGCTDNVDRRNKEHKRNPFNQNHNEYNTYKYQFCRFLTEHNIEYNLEELVTSAEIDDENDEYEWILKFARYNEDNGIKFYDDLPLTNMKAGDFLDEMLKDRSIKTASDIKKFKQTQKQNKKKNIVYTRDQFGKDPNASKRKNILDGMAQWVQERSTEQVIKDLDKRAKQQRQDAELIELRRQQTAEYQRTGKLLGEK